MCGAVPRHGSFLGETITLTRWLGSLCFALSGVVLVTNPGSAGVLDASWTSPTTNTDGSALTALASYRVYYVASDASPCPGFTFLEVASPTTTPNGETVSVALAGLTTNMFYTVAVTAVDLGGNESACSATARAVARDDGSTSGQAAVSPSDPGAVSSNESGAVNPSDPIAAISSDGVAVNSTEGVAVNSTEGVAVNPTESVAVNPTDTADSGTVDGGADTGDQVWRWRYWRPQ